MEFVVLGLLFIRSQTLYELNKAFQQSISLFYSASYGSLQAASKKLLEQRYILFEEHLDNGRNKKIYRITEEGRRAFLDWMHADIPENKLEVTALSKVFFLGLIESKELKRSILEEIIRKLNSAAVQLRGLETELNRQPIAEHHKQIFHYQLKTLDYGIQAHTFALSWFRTLQQELQEELD